MLSIALALGAAASPPAATTGDAPTSAHTDDLPAPPHPPDDGGAAPIVRGGPEAGYPSAVGLGAAGFTLCSGSLIAPRVVLTAAHCSAELPIEAVVQFGQAYVGAEASEPEATLLFSGAAIHPDYQPLSSFDLGQNDVAVLFLQEDAPVDPVWIRTEPLKPRQDVGVEVVSVGWGVDENDVAGVKRSASLVVGDIDDRFLYSFSSDNEGGANVCSGDSGGPQYHLGDDGTLVQWAVHSWADVGCVYQSGSTRIDKLSDWIIDQVEAEHGTRDRCAVLGQYDDGICHADCERFDRDCFELEAPEVGVPSGCTIGRGAPGIAGVLLASTMAFPFRRGRGSKGRDATEVPCACPSPPCPSRSPRPAPPPPTSTAASCPTTAC